MTFITNGVHANGGSTSVDSSSRSSDKPATLADPADYFMQVFQEVICDTSEAALRAVPRYFDRSYTQFVDGKQLSYDGFLTHMRAQKSKIAPDVRIDWHELHAVRSVEHGREVVLIISHHSVKARMRSDDSAIDGSVVALMKMDAKSGKIFQCNEHTHMRHASKEARDLGSTTEHA